MEAICDPDNIETALDAWCATRERPALMDHRQAVASILKARWREIEEQLLQGATNRNRYVGWKSEAGRRRDAQSRHSNCH